MTLYEIFMLLSSFPLNIWLTLVQIQEAVAVITEPRQGISASSVGILALRWNV